MIALVFVAAAMARLVSAWHVGHDLTLRELLRGSVTRAWPLLAAWTMVHLLELVSVLGLGILPLAVMTWFLVTAPIIGAEGIGPDRRDAPLGPPRDPSLLDGAGAGVAQRAGGAPVRDGPQRAADPALLAVGHRWDRLGADRRP